MVLCRHGAGLQEQDLGLAGIGKEKSLASSLRQSRGESREHWSVAVSIKGGKGQKKKGIKNKGRRGLWRKKSGCRLGRNKKKKKKKEEKKKKSKNTIINASYPGRNIQPKGLSFPPFTSSKQFPLIRKRILDTSPVACPWKGLSSRGNGNEQWWCYSSRAVTGNTATKTQQAERQSSCQALGLLCCGGIASVIETGWKHYSSVFLDYRLLYSNLDCR